MSLAMTVPREKPHFLQWLGGFFVLLGGIWVCLLIRDLYQQVLSTDANRNTIDAFAQEETLIGAVAAVAGIIVGTWIFIKGSPKALRERATKRKHHHQHHHHKRTGPSRPATAPPVSSAAESVSLEAPSADANAPTATLDEPGQPQLHRVKRRIRVRVRKEKKK
jgi:hypothetical protein